MRLLKTGFDVYNSDTPLGKALREALPEEGIKSITIILSADEIAKVHVERILPQSLEDVDWGKFFIDDAEIIRNPTARHLSIGCTETGQRLLLELTDEQVACIAAFAQVVKDRQIASVRPAEKWDGKLGRSTPVPEESAGGQCL